MPSTLPEPHIKLTPMLMQYQDIKARYPGCLLFFRLGDFYEMFFDDAVTASKILDITLTRRGKHEGDEIPMCGVPFHAAESYIAKLIKSGQKIAICEQLENPEDAKKRGGHKAVVKRDVIRVITPGTLTEDHLLDAKSHNFLAALAQHRDIFSLSVIDISTGDFWVESCSQKDLASLFARIHPKETLLPQKLRSSADLIKSIEEWTCTFTSQPDSRFEYTSNLNRLQSHLKVQSLESFGPFLTSDIMAAGALLEYVSLTQCGNLPALAPLRKLETHIFLHLDAATRRNLELTSTLRGDFHGSFLWAIDRTVTSGGGRLLRRRLANPLSSSSAIGARLDEVSWLKDQSLTDLHTILKTLPDLERILSRLSLGRGGPRDLKALHSGLEQIAATSLWISSISENPGFFTDIHGIPALFDLLNKALRDAVPILARDGDFIRDGFNPELDELHSLRSQGSQKIAALQGLYVQETGIPTLKIKYNNVLGYYIEVTLSHKDKIKDPKFIHRQTLVSGIRYTTLDLSELEQKILGAQEASLQLEFRIFEDLLSEVRLHFETLSSLARRMNALDVTLSMATLAVSWHYTRPQVDESLTLSLRGGRHPVIEQLLHKEGAAQFTPNDCTLDAENPLWLLTGPNMAGKSTFLRQNALLILLAHMGSFVPAESAHIGCVDRVFSRVGASDDLSKGHSTFMVEMIETATILNQATPKSFVILDEVGRGTATYDGVALAWSVTEYLRRHNQCRGIFATHYHELTELSTTLPGLSCHRMAVKEWHHEVVFLHRVIPGAFDKSYGIYVAQLAGIPASVVARAQDLLTALEEKTPQKNLPSPTNCEKSRNSPVEDKLLSLNPDALTPREALDFLYQLKALAVHQ